MIFSAADRFIRKERRRTERQLVEVMLVAAPVVQENTAAASCCITDRLSIPAPLDSSVLRRLLAERICQSGTVRRDEAALQKTIKV